MFKLLPHHHVVVLFTIIIGAALLNSCAEKPSKTRGYFPEVGANALHQRALDVRSNLKVLSVSLRPGYEDFATLAYFRLGRGAVLTSLYVTNSEAGESDVRGEYPPHLAAMRRAEAVRAMQRIDGEARFLNLPDIVAARDTTQARALWPGDSLRLKLSEFITQFRPDLILLHRDWAMPGSPSWEILRADLLTAVQNAASGTVRDLSGNGSLANWTVSRLAMDMGRSDGLTVPVNERHPRWKKSYAQIGAEAGQAYASLAVQRRLWQQGQTPSYAVEFPAANGIKTLTDGLPVPVSQQLRGIEIQLEALTDKAFNGEKREILPRTAALIDSVEYTLALNQLTLTAAERKCLLQWKAALENLRCTLLGVEVDYTVSDTVLTDQQLTYVAVNEVKGLSKDGTTEILFAGIDQSWAVNEDLAKKMPLELKTEYRLLTPKGLVYNFPPAQHPFQLAPRAKTVLLFIIHRAKTKAENFIYRSMINFDFAPKFVAEVLTPIVRMAPNERVVVRLMNISRDGVADTLEVADALAHSFRHPFRLSRKDTSKIDTLTLAWEGNPDDGTHLIPVSIDGVPVAQFAARKFTAEVDHAKRLGLITSIENSPTAEALRRLDLVFNRVSVTPKPESMQRLQTFNVLIIDRRALSLQPEIAVLQAELNRFVEAGGHLIVLAQDAAAWNAKPLWEGMRLTATSQFEAAMPVQVEAGEALLNKPNLLAADDWNDWLFLRGYNVISGEALAAAKVPIRAGFTGSPLVITAPAGQGRRTYVDLALSPQLMNIHAGAFRVLANLISL
jgi:LmbE family N-acetylglucosaminyl deacetylase